MRVVTLSTVNCRYAVFSFWPGLVDLLVALGAQRNGLLARALSICSKGYYFAPAHWGDVLAEIGAICIVRD